MVDSTGNANDLVERLFQEIKFIAERLINIESVLMELHSRREWHQGPRVYSSDGEPSGFLPFDVAGTARNQKI